MFEAQADAFFFFINVEDDDVEHLADDQHFAWVVQAAPRHIGDVEQAVHAAEVDEGAEVGDIFNGAGDFVAGFDGFEEALALFGAFRFDDFAAGEDDVFAIVVDLDDLEFVNIADVSVEFLWWDDVDLGAGQECFDADVDGQAAFDHGFDLAFDQSAFVEDFDDLVPVLFVGGFFLGDDDHAFVILEFLEEDFDFIADLDVFVFEFGRRDDAF